MSESQVGILLSYLDEVGIDKIKQAVDWSNRYKVTTSSESADYRQIAALVRLYEMAFPFSSTIGEILCDRSSADASKITSWLRNSFEFPTDVIYTMLTSWMRSCSPNSAFSAFDINRKYNIMQEAALKGDEDLIQWLLKQNVDVDFRDSSEQTALHVAAESGHEYLVRFLLKRGASVFCLDSSGETPFEKALDRGHFETADLLHPHLFMRKKLDDYILVVATLQGSLRKVKYLLKYVSECDPHFERSLRVAARNGYTDIVEAMLMHSYGSTCLNARNSDGDTPLSLASENGHANVVEKLLAAGAYIDEKTVAVIGKSNNIAVLKVFKKFERNLEESDTYV